MMSLEPTSPGENLQEEFLEPMNITAYRLAKEVHIPQSRISDIISGKRRITADTAMRFARYFGTTPQFWLNIQNQFDLDMLKVSGKVVDMADIRPFSLMQGWAIQATISICIEQGKLVRYLSEHRREVEDYMFALLSDEELKEAYGDYMESIIINIERSGKGIPLGVPLLLA